MPSLVRGCDAVLHVATAIPRDMTAPNAWDANTRVRTEGTRLLLESALTHGAAVYVQQSIVMAYEDGGDEWLDESTPLDSGPARAIICGPVVAMESMVRAIPPGRLRWCILRGGSFVGPETFQDDLVAGLRAGRATVPCEGRHFISPIHVADMASAVVAALDRAPSASTFHIVDSPIRYGDCIDRLAELVGVAPPARVPQTPCPPSFRCTNDAARTVLEWAPRTTIWPFWARQGRSPPDND